MRQLELTTILDEDSVRELATGHHLQLVFQKIPVAEIVPVDLATLAGHQREHNQKHASARSALLDSMERGINMGGFKITNRDELYDRD